MNDSGRRTSISYLPVRRAAADSSGHQAARAVPKDVKAGIERFDDHLPIAAMNPPSFVMPMMSV
jgi:hypothetical protein